VQLPELPNDPLVGEDAKETVPVGVLAPLEAVSLTAAARDDPYPGGGCSKSSGVWNAVGL